MSWATQLLSRTGGYLADVTSAFRLKTDLAKHGDAPAEVGSVLIVSENDDGSVTGTPYLKSPETSSDFRLRTGIDSILFQDNFNATAQNTQIWKYVSSTLTAAMSGGFLQINSAAAGNTGTYVSMQTFQYFPLVKTAPLYIDVDFILSSAPIPANERFRIGLFVPSTTNLPIDGCYAVLSSVGLQIVMNFNGTETSTTLAGFTPSANTNYHLCLVVGVNEVEVWIDDVLMGEVDVPAGNSQPFMQGALPLSVECVNTGAVTGAMTLKIGSMQVSIADLAFGFSVPEVQALAGLGGGHGQNGQTQGQSTQWANAAEPTGAAATNTTAALGTGLGGLFKANAMATSATDIIISSFLNPASTINITGRNLVIRGVWVDVMNQVTAVATTAFGFAMALAYGHTALSLATAETGSFATGTTHAPRKVPIGFLYLPVAAPVGQAAGKQYVQFAAPIIVRPGEYVAIVAKVIVGTATASETLLFLCGFNAYFH